MSAKQEDYKSSIVHAHVQGEQNFEAKHWSRLVEKKHAGMPASQMEFDAEL